MKKLKAIISDYMQTRKDVKELLGIMGKSEVIEVMREYNLMLGGANNE